MLLFAGMNTAIAQDAPKQKMSPEQRAEKQTKMMVNKLNLNDQQAEQVMQINKETAAKMRPLVENGKENKEKMKSVLSERDSRLKSVLTEEQYGNYEHVKQERMDKRKERRMMRK